MSTTNELDSVYDPGSNTYFHSMPSNILCFPFAKENANTTGVLCLLNKKKSYYQQKEIEILDKALQFVGITINNFQLSSFVAHLEDDANLKNEKILNELKKSKILLEFAVSLYQEDNLSKLMETIISRARDLLSADKASVFVVDKERKEVIKLELKEALFFCF